MDFFSEENISCILVNICKLLDICIVEKDRDKIARLKHALDEYENALKRRSDDAIFTKRNDSTLKIKYRIKLDPNKAIGPIYNCNS